VAGNQPFEPLNTSQTNLLRVWLLMGMAFLLPFKAKGINFFPAAYTLLWLISGSWKTSFKSLAFNKTSLLLVLFWLLHLIGMFWTSNVPDGLFDLEVKFSLLLFPIILIDQDFVNKVPVHQILKSFAFGTVSALLICFTIALFSPDAQRFYYTTFSAFMHPGYFAMYICFTVVIFLNDFVKEPKILGMPSWANLVCIGIMVAGIILLASKLGLVLLVIILLWFWFRNFKNKSLRVINVILTLAFVAIIYAAFEVPFVHDRIYEMVNTLEPGYTSLSSSGMRLQVWKATGELIRSNFLIGTGTGDIKDELIKRYVAHGYSYVAHVRLNAHNQFLQSFAALGISGIFLLIAILVSGWRYAKKSGNSILIWLLAIVAINMLVESVLEVQAGVMFFAFFLPLMVRPQLETTVYNPIVLPGYKQVWSDLKTYYQLHPLRFSLIAGFLLRLIAVVYSKGFGMHDDHFLVIEASQAWVDGTDYDNWLPAYGGVTPDGHSFFYSGLHYLFFHVLKFIGIADPQLKMVFVRLVHAILSLGTIYFGFKIAYKISDLKSASTVGLLLACFWFMPWLSVRNLVEVVCIPFLIGGSWLAISAHEKERPNRAMFWAGAMLGVAFCIRFQTVLFIGGTGLALILLNRWKSAILVGLGSISVFVLTQAPVDYFIWGAPFAQFTEYVKYNMDNAYSYIVGPWYNYTLLILGILIPPLSFFLFFGWLRQWKKQLVIFLPVLVFLAFHSYFPNKQERFILPIVPFFIILGIPGWNNWLSLKGREAQFKKVINISWAFFWSLNIILLPFITSMYSKRARVESMSYLYPKRSEIKSILMEDTNRGSAKMAPEFYLGKWIDTYELSEQSGYDSLEFYLNKYGPDDYPQYALFLGDKRLDERVNNLKAIFPGLELEKVIEPGFVDKVLYWMNPKNANDVIYIYKVNYIAVRPPDVH